MIVLSTVETKAMIRLLEKASISAAFCAART
jgi:hypothetical protein